MHPNNVIVMKGPDGGPWYRSWRTVDRSSTPVTSGLESTVALAQFMASPSNEFEGMIGSSANVHEVLDQIRTVAPTDSMVLIEGETGTGQELIAHAIHTLS